MVLWNILKRVPGSEGTKVSEPSGLSDGLVVV